MKNKPNSKRVSKQKQITRSRQKQQQSSLLQSKAISNKPNINYKISQQKKKISFIKYDHVQTLNKIHQWRIQNQAPVDVVGCQRLYDRSASIQVQKYQILISLMLSIQTKDQITSMVVQRLKKIGLQPNIIAKMQQQEILQLIKQSNFNKRKAKHIKEASQIICMKGLPKTKEECMRLPGIGLKIAMLYMKCAQGKNDGIGVDTHVHRISNKLGWVHTNNPNETQEQLQNLFHSKYWKNMNVDLVGFGQILCQAKNPKCLKCPVNDRCPSVQF